MMRSIQWLVVHTCGAYDALHHKVIHQTVETVRAYHMRPASQGGRGWHDIGYHRYIEESGAVRMGRLDATIGAHATGFNEHSLGICCSGDGDYAPFNPAQMASLIEQCALWCRLYKISPDHVIGHHETANYGGPPVQKTCPGTLVDMGAIRHQVRDALGGLALPGSGVGIA